MTIKCSSEQYQDFPVVMPNAPPPGFRQPLQQRLIEMENRIAEGISNVEANQVSEWLHAMFGLAEPEPSMPIRTGN
jgi:hypothetical protein